ncbi:unnamed protein product, partial [Ectocarpus fasciculatus]
VACPDRLPTDLLRSAGAAVCVSWIRAHLSLPPRGFGTMDTLAQREATQLRLNAELDAGARAAISDMETYLCAPAARLPNTKRPSGGNVSGDVNDNFTCHTDGRPGGLTVNSGASSTAVRVANGPNTNRTNGNTRGTPFRADSKRTSPTQPGVKVVPHSMMSGVEGGNGINLATSQPGTAARSPNAVSRTRGGGVWDTDINDTNNFSFNIDHDDSVQHGGRQEHGVVATARGGAATTESPLFRLSERVKGAARASGERRMLKKAASGCSLSPRPGDYANRHNSFSETKQEGGMPLRSQQQHQQGSRPTGMGPGSSRGVGRGQLNADSSRAETPRGGDAQGAQKHTGGGVPAGIGEEATSRFLKAKLAACQAQLEEVLQAHQSSQQETAELRRQCASDQEQTRRAARQLQQLQQTKSKESKAKEEDALNIASLSARVNELEQELGSSRRAARQAETDKKSLEVRLHRALEEVSKQKEAVRQTRGQHKDLGQGQRLEMARLEGHCQRLERQKLELLSAFKKQLKLIDVLKRQKFHVEAARLLGFTEEDFVKTLDWDA